MNPFFAVKVRSSLALRVVPDDARTSAAAQTFRANQWQPLWSSEQLIPGWAVLPLPEPGAQLIKVAVTLSANKAQTARVEAEIRDAGGAVVVDAQGKPRRQTANVSGTNCTGAVEITIVVIA